LNITKHARVRAMPAEWKHGIAKYFQEVIEAGRFCWKRDIQHFPNFVGRHLAKDLAITNAAKIIGDQFGNRMAPVPDFIRRRIKHFAEYARCFGRCQHVHVHFI
jgi:hypothetical protein